MVYGLLRNPGRMTRAVVAGVVLFVLLSIFASDPSPDEQPSATVERTCKNDWRKCASDEDLLKNWSVELKPTGRPRP
jgi:hypothetical protein